MKKKLTLLAALIIVLLSACSQKTDEPATLTVMTHDSFAISEDVVAIFEQEYGVEVRFLQSGDAGTMLNQAILSREAPLADVLYGVDNTFLSRALAEDIFLAYESPRLESIPDAFQLDGQHRAIPIDYGDVCLNYDIAYFQDAEINPPADLDALTQPEYESLLVVENPATSSPGLAFLLATIGHFGSDGYLDYWADIRANDVLVVNDWETAYYCEFSHSGGTRPIVVSYGSSPPAEVYFAEEELSEPPTGVVTANTSCFRQIEFAGILRGTENEDLAQAWIDFMLSIEFQEDMPLNMFVYPVISQAELPSVFAQYAVIPAETAYVAPDDIAAQRDAWIDAWTQAVLR
jgi:thiamine transport system substrate-binding protein